MLWHPHNLFEFTMTLFVVCGSALAAVVKCLYWLSEAFEKG